MLTNCAGSSRSIPSSQKSASHTVAAKTYLRGQRPTAAHRAGAIAKISAQQHGRRSPSYYVNHFTCTDWFIWVPDNTSYAYATDPGAGNYVSGSWEYYTTTCDYVDSFWVDDGTGIYGGGTSGSNPSNPTSNRDNLIAGCKTAAGTANRAESTHVYNDPGYEYAGFVLQAPDGSYWYSQGELLSLNDNLSDIGAPGDHSFPPGYTVIGYYHTHPGKSPDMLDSTTMGHFSKADEDYANRYNIDAYVMMIWNDTSSGSSVEKTSFASWKHGSDPKADKDESSTGC
jgi:hypothetical protein